MPIKGKIQLRYEALDAQRSSLKTRWQEYAELTIPSLYPREGFSETSELPVPFSSMAARGVNRLSSRIVSTLAPLNNLPFFSLGVDDQETVDGDDPTPQAKFLTRIERRMMEKLSTTNYRSTLNSAVQCAMALGESLIVAESNYNYSMYKPSQYVIRRRPDGKWHEVIIKTPIDKTMLPQLLKDNGVVELNDKATMSGPATGYNQSCAMFTHVKNNQQGGCTIEREFESQSIVEKDKDGVPIPGEYKVCPYFPLKWILVNGENYGRGLIEDNLGDIRCLEVMAEALIDAIAANSEYRFGVNPAGLTELHDLQNSVNGQFVPAAKDDVFPIQLANQAAVMAAQNSVTLKEQTLGQVFLMNSVVQPQGDRVTAAQVRIIASELEQALGGVFSGVGPEVLVPLVKRLLYSMLRDRLLLSDAEEESKQLIEELEKDDALLTIKVKTGIEALSREVDGERMSEIMDKAIALPQAAQDAVSWPGMLNRWVTSKGVEPNGIIISTEEVDQNKAAAAQAQVQDAAAQQAIQTGGAIAESAATAPQQ